jgi:N-acetylmuramoyl-L-alanine amidase
MNMKLQRRQLLGYPVLLLAAPQLVFGAGIVAVRVWPAREYTRVTIESDAVLAATHLLLEQPPRLVVDIDQLGLDQALRELVGQVRPDDPYIAGVRVGQFQPRVVRLVFDLKQGVRPELFTLEPVPPYRHRLVFDLFPRQEEDPLLALVREKEAAGTAAASAIDDALGELIARIEGRPMLLAGPSAPTPPAVDEPVPPLVAQAPAPPAPPATPAMPPGPASAAAPSALPSRPAPPPAPLMTPAPPPPASPAERRQAQQLVIIALDPGHGGEDPGAVGPTGLREKDVVLAIALKLRDRLNALPGVGVLMARDGGFFVPLAERVRKARRVQADLFVSIHADAFVRRSARGASVYVLSDRGATSSAARWMAERENAADRVGGVNLGSVHGVSDRQVLRAMADMSTTAQIRSSLDLGDELLQRIGGVGRLHKRQVEQAGFAVLKAPDIPSVLVETAFISNPEEERRLRDPAFRAQLVKALALGIQRWLARHPPLARRRQL